MIHRTAAAVVALAALLALPAAGQAKLEDLPGFYRGVKTDQWAEYKLALTTGNDTHEFDVRYQVKSVGSFSVTLTVERLHAQTKKDAPKGARTLADQAIKSRDGTSFREQLLMSYDSYGYTEVKIKKLEVAGAENVTPSGGAAIACTKVRVEFEAKQGGVPVEGQELYWINTDLPVMKTAKIEAIYKVNRPGEPVLQKLVLVLSKHGKQ